MRSEQDSRCAAAAAAAAPSLLPLLPLLLPLLPLPPAAAAAAPPPLRLARVALRFARNGGQRVNRGLRVPP